MLAFSLCPRSLSADNLTFSPVSAVDYLRALLIQRQTALERLSNAYQLAADNNIELEGGRRVWDEHWDGSAVAAGEEHGGSIKAER